MPQERGFPVQTGSAPLAVLEANTDSFLEIFFEPQCGQGVPSHLALRTSSSLSFPHFPQ
jgi:hypothetical protein